MVCVYISLCFISIAMYITSIAIKFNGTSMTLQYILAVNNVINTYQYILMVFWYILVNP
jgi:hypothetical protein